MAKLAELVRRSVDRAAVSLMFAGCHRDEQRRRIHAADPRGEGERHVLARLDRTGRLMLRAIHEWRRAARGRTLLAVLAGWSA